MLISSHSKFTIFFSLILTHLSFSISAYTNISYSTAIYGEATGFQLYTTGVQQLKQTFAFPSPSPFTSPPQILIAYQRFDVSMSSHPLENVQAEITSISVSSFDLEVSRAGQNKIFDTQFQYLAIETSNYAFIDKNQLNKSTDTDTSQSTSGFQVLKKLIPYKRALSNASETRKISVYFTGYTKSIDPNVQAQTTFNLYVYAQQTVPQGFYVIAESRDPKDDVNFLQTVYFNYIEFYQPANGYFSMKQIPNMLYLNQNVPTMDSNGDTLIHNNLIKVDIDNRRGLFLGMTNVGYVAGTTFARIQILAQSFVFGSPSSLSTFSYDINSWSSAQMNSFAFELLTFTRVDCQSNSELFYDELQICANPCPNGSFTVYPQCKSCYSLCQTCTGQLQTQCTSCTYPYYLFVNLCYSTQPNSTGCSVTSRNCVSCKSNRCLKCDYNTPSNCLVCKDTFTLSESDHQCKCEDPMYYSESEQNCKQKPSPFSKETEEAASTSGKAAFYSNIALVIMQRLTNSGSVLISSAFTNQKIYYILLLNSGIPTYLRDFTRTVINQSVLEKFKLINWLNPKEPSYNVGYRFDDERVPSDILANSGGAIIVLFFISIFYACFFIALRSKQLRDRLMKPYISYVASFLIESTEICVLVLQFSAVIAITHLETLFQVNDLALNIMVIFLSEAFIVSFLIFSSFQLYQIFPQCNSIQEPNIIQQIFINPLLNNCMKEFWYTKVYMMIFVGIDGVLFPILIVIARMEYTAQIIGLIFLQLFELVCTILIKPFYLKRETYLFIIEQANILLIYITIAIIELCFPDNSDENSAEYPKIVTSLSILYVVLIFIALLTRTFVQICLLIKELIAYCRKRKQSQFHLNRSRQNQILLNVKNHTHSKLGIELTKQNKNSDLQSRTFNDSTRDSTNNQKMFQYTKYMQTPENMLRAQLQRTKYPS